MVDAQTKMQFMFALRAAGVTDTKVLNAMERVPRHDFVQGHFAPRAYEDMAIPIASGQTISQPSIVGKMTQALNVGPRDKVLEIGTGSGYQAAILSHLARRVYTVERHRGLARDARRLLDGMRLVRVGGIMVLPVGQTDAVQHLIKVEKTENGFEYTELEPVRFVPLVEGVAQEP